MENISANVYVQGRSVFKIELASASKGAEGRDQGGYILQYRVYHWIRCGPSVTLGGYYMPQTLTGQCYR